MNYDTDEDAVRCAYCDRPFGDERRLALHRGLVHEHELTPEERAAFEDTRETEREELRLFRLKALGVLVLLYFGLLMAFALFA
jgi:hypothetical protein